MSRLGKIAFLILSSLAILILESEMAFASNDIFVENYIGLTKGRLCWRVDEKELSTFKKVSCRYPYSSDLLYTSNNNIFEWSVFQKSADLQVKKNECIRQKISAIVNDDKLLEQWAVYLKQSWLGMKKAQLALEKCENFNQKTKTPSKLLHFPQFVSKKGLDPKMTEICGDEERLALLSASQELFVFSMPIVSDAEFFDFIQEERDGLINKKTGKPLSSEEIRSSSLKELADVELSKKSMGSLLQKIKKKFRELSYERQTQSEDLVSKRDKKTKAYDIDSATKDFLFEDNTVYETLADLKLLGNTDEAKGSQVPMGVKCLLNHYQSDGNAEFAEFIAFSLVSYGAIFKIFNLGKLSRLAALKKGGLGAAAASGEVRAIKEIAKMCRSDLYQQTKFGGRKVKEFPDFDTKPLEEEFAFKFHNLEIPRDKTPACKGLEKNVVANDFKRSGCLMNALEQQLFAF